MNKGDIIYFLSEYHWYKGRVAAQPRAASKTIQVEYAPWGTPIRTRVKREKTALPGESVCVVWETWRRDNAYRVERDLYPNIRIPAEKVSHNHIHQAGRIDEHEQPEVNK